MQDHQKRIEAELYSYRVQWSEQDQEYIGLCAEFPSLSWLDASQGATLNGIVKVVGDVIADLLRTGENVLFPLSIKNYSGKLSVRILPELHRKLDVDAHEERVSLNRPIANRLAQK